MDNDRKLNISLVGSGGDGVMATASMILRTAAQMGLYGMMTQSYGPQIRGGESAAHLTIGTEPVRSVGIRKDIIVVFRFADALRFTKEIAPADHVILIHSKDGGETPAFLQNHAGVDVPVAFTEILEREKLPEICKNVLVYGMIIRALNWDMAHGEQCIREVFSHKSEEIQLINIRALTAGYKLHLPKSVKIEFPQGDAQGERNVLSGNEACADAAIRAGCRFYAGYPITPSTEVLEFMYEKLPGVGGQFIQAEDEIASIGMVIGASYGGVRAMTATSGPGLSLMTEMLGLSSLAEIPIVILDCQRGGPSTGLPSRVEQSDLWHCMYGGHGDFPRVVMAATDVADCYQTIFRAFYCSETFQMPVIVLTDASIGQRSEIIDPVDTSMFPRGQRMLATLPEPPAEPQTGSRPTTFKRYDLGNDHGCKWAGVTPVAIPGMAGGMHSIAGIEHGEKGMPTGDGDVHEAMNQKRFLKLRTLAFETSEWFTVHGPMDAAHVIVAWGSTAAAAHDYISTRNDTCLFVPHILHPFPVAGLQRVLKGRRSACVLEMNYQGQLHQHLRGIGAISEWVKSLRRSGGLPFQSEEVAAMMIEGGVA